MKTNKRPTTRAGRDEQSKLYRDASALFDNLHNTSDKHLPGDKGSQKHRNNEKFREFIFEKLAQGRTAHQFNKICKDSGYKIYNYNRETKVWEVANEEVTSRRFKQRFNDKKEELKKKKRANEGNCKKVAQKQPKKQRQPKKQKQSKEKISTEIVCKNSKKGTNMLSLFIEDAPESKRKRLNDSIIKHEEEDVDDDVGTVTSPQLVDAASARLIKLTSDQIQLMKYPVGCSVWYDIQPGTQDMKVKVGVVKSISVDVTTRNVLYEITPSFNSKGTKDEMLYVEEQLCYASKCIVNVVQHDKCMKGEVITCNTCWADKSLKKSYMVSLFLEENQISILPSVDEDNVKFCQAARCSSGQSGLPVRGNEKSSMDGESDERIDPADTQLKVNSAATDEDANS